MRAAESAEDLMKNPARIAPSGAEFHGVPGQLALVLIQLPRAYERGLRRSRADGDNADEKPDRGR